MFQFKCRNWQRPLSKRETSESISKHSDSSRDKRNSRGERIHLTLKFIQFIFGTGWQLRELLIDRSRLLNRSLSYRSRDSILETKGKEKHVVAD